MGGHEEQPATRIERRRLEIRAAVIVWKALLRRAEIIEHDRPAGLVELPGPVRVDERFTDEELAGLTVDCVEESVPIGHHDRFSRLTADREIGEHRHVRRIPVVHIVRSELVVPAQLAGVRVERHK